MTIITSRANPLIKQIKKLQHKKYRTTSYLIEGWHLFEEAKRANVTFYHIFVLEAYQDKVQGLENVVLVSQSVLEELAQSPSPQGIVAEVALEQPQWPTLSKGRYLVLEDVQDPGNVGTLIRTADAAGFDGVFISDKSADIYNAKTLRSMQGSHFHLPIIRCSIPSLLTEAVDKGSRLLASTLSKESIDYRLLPNYTNFILVMGNEGQGISETTAQMASQLIHITMPGQAESLNVAVAGGILMFGLI